MTEARKGFLLGVAAYAIWGLFPLYWPLLEPAGAVEILAQRIVWSCVVMGLLVLALRRRSVVRRIAADRRTRSLLALAACLITVNWAVYIWGVNNGHVVETSLGYFVNPLVTVLMGVFILGERLRRWQWVALGVAGLAVVALTLDYGRPPWIALTLALTFGSYGLCKKQANAPAIESISFETMLTAPIALGYLAVLTWHGQSNFTDHGPGHMLLLMSAGIVTAVPLVCFGGAAIRVPLVTLGLLQYLTPILQFGLGVLYFHESMPAGRWVGFGLVWIALAILTAESVTHRRTAGAAGTAGAASTAGTAGASAPHATGPAALNAD